MVRRLLAIGISLIAVACGASQALAGPGTEGSSASGVLDPVTASVLTTLGDDAFSLADLTAVLPAGDPTERVGPFPSNTEDSGSCGNDWASDQFNGFYTVRLNPDGTYTVYWQVKDGTFVTHAGVSPGSCNIGPQPQTPGTVVARVTGNILGYEVNIVTGHYNGTGVCINPCFPSDFVAMNFTGGSIIEVPAFYFHYDAPRTSTPPNSTLTGNEWKDASSNRGGMVGDIKTP